MFNTFSYNLLIFLFADDKKLVIIKKQLLTKYILQQIKQRVYVKDINKGYMLWTLAKDISKGHKLRT